MMQTYELFYKQHGVRRIQELFNPRMFDMEQFHFPRNSAYHFVSHDEAMEFPDESKPYIQEIHKRILVDYIDQLSSTEGNPRRTNKQASLLFRPFQSKHKKFKYAKDPSSFTKDVMTLVTYSYGLLQSLYRYMDLPLTPYYKWYNIEKTFWDHASDVISEDTRQHFVFFSVPEIIPSVSTLRVYSDKKNPTLINVFDTPEKLMVLEFWKWLDEGFRSSSMITGLDKDKLHRLNLVVTFGNKWCVLNLGKFDSWRKDGEEKAEQASTTLSPQQFQKLFLKFIMGVQASGQVTLPEEELFIEENPELDEDTKDLHETEDNTKDEDEESQNLFTGLDGSKKTYLFQKDTDDHDEEEIEVPKFDETSLDKELEALDFIEKKNLELKGVKSQDSSIQRVNEPSETDVKDLVYKSLTPSEALVKEIDKDAEYGIMPASEYRLLMKQAERFSDMKDPYSKNEKITDFTQIQKDDLRLDMEKTKMKDIPSVIDKTMLESRLLNFDKNYISKIMRKDIVRMVENIQRGGLIIQDYSVQEDASALGEFEFHTLKIKPVDGAASTVHFRLPKVDSNGEFKVNGNKYRMRKQRVDLPIRKISSTNVSLSSYYGRVNIELDQKKANNSSAWLTSQIMTLGLGDESDHIRDIAPANVFDNLFKAPKIYSTLAKKFRSLTLGQNKFIFDHTAREKILDPELLKKVEGKDKLFVGFDKAKNPIVVDFNDEFHVWKNGVYEPIGDFYALALLDASKAPVDFTNVKIFSKAIPIGVVLGYMIGFSNLLKLMGVQPKVYGSRERVELKSGEWVLRFADKKLVFSRKDREASLIFGGFDAYHKSIKAHTFENFDRKNVYLNLLEDAGITARYLKEIDLLDKLFVDPVTQEILEGMNEPVTFKGLLVRASELLVNDYHPDSQDMRFMRIRGYERFSGAVYKELVNSMRDFKSRNIRGKSAVELNPYAVWKMINQDNSNILVADINPIENLKQVEAVTFVGEGGRNKDAMSIESRIYHKSDMGVISEATVDSSDVAINSFLAANPLFKDVRGLTEVIDLEKNGVSSLFSTSALLAPGAEQDDPKRVNIEMV